jgi:cytochrome c biogenesis protein CcdA
VSLQIDLLFAVSGGVLTAFSPCGAPLLPNLFLYLMQKEQRDLRPSWGVASFLAGTTLFVAPLTALSIFAASSIQSQVPWLLVVAGVALLAMAAGSARGIALPLPRLLRSVAQPKGYGGLAVLGVMYAAAAIGCFSGLFFAIVAVATTGDGPTVLAVFLASFLLPTVLLAAVASESGETLRRWLTRASAAIKRANTSLLALVGAWLLFYFFVGVQYLGWPV